MQDGAGPFRAAAANVRTSQGPGRRRQPQTLEQLEDDYFDLIITLSPQAHHAALELTRSNAVEVIYWPTMDPTVATGTREQILDAYREVRDHLSSLIESRLVKRNGVAAQSA